MLLVEDFEPRVRLTIKCRFFPLMHRWRVDRWPTESHQD